MSLAGIFRRSAPDGELVYNTTHSLIEQSRAAHLTTHLTNADGFGIDWCGTSELSGVYRNVSRAWSDRNLRDLCAQIPSPLFLAHVRATTGMPVQQTNWPRGRFRAAGQPSGR